MKLTVLVDNNTLIDRYFIGEPGLSYLIEDEGTNILFDVGYSDAFLKNAGAMGLSLLDIDSVVLSHSHLDHTWGLVPLIKYYTEAAIEKRPFKRPAIVTHPMAFHSRRCDDIMEFGSMISKESLSRHFEMKLSKEPVHLTDKLVFLGEIERNNDFEARTSIGKVVMGPDGNEEDDFMDEDSAMVYKSSRGLVVITGCSHSGICNIVEQAKKVCREERIADIIGGFHLQEAPQDVLAGTLEYMKKINPEKIHACHCTDLPAKIALAGVADLKEVGVGLTIEYK